MVLMVEAGSPIRALRASTWVVLLIEEENQREVEERDTPEVYTCFRWGGERRVHTCGSGLSPSTGKEFKLPFCSMRNCLT